MAEITHTPDKKNSRIQLIITLVSILIPVFVTIGIKLFEKESKEISLYISKPVNILSNGNALDDDIKLYYDSVEVKNISTFQLMLINSGNQYISSEDFKDGAIEFVVSSKNRSIQTKQIPCILDVSRSDDAKQRNSKLNFYEKNGNGTIEYLPSLLNPDDAVIIDVFIPEDKNVDIDYVGKIKEGTINNLQPYSELEKQSEIAKLVSSIHNIFGYKWISILIFVLFVASMALGVLTFGVAVTEEDDEFKDLTLGAKTIFIIMAGQVLLFLTMLVFVTIY